LTKIRHLALLSLATVMALTLACSSNNGGSKSGSNGTAANTTGGGPQPVAGQAVGTPVDGIPCESSEQLTYHVHAHLTIVANGQVVPVPAYTGIVDNHCIYWLHTHDTSGVVHIEAPSQRAFTLGQFFDVWGQPLSASQVLGFKADGQHSVQFFVDGQPYNGDPRQIPLGAHTLITIEYGPPFPMPPSFTFPQGL
jgi:hypothetical protein